MTSGPWQNIKILMRNRALISYLVRSSQHSSHFRTFLGRIWFLLDPMAHLAIYYFVVVEVFQARLRLGLNPFVFIMAGLAHYQILQAAVNLGRASILSNRNVLLQIKVEPLVFVTVNFWQAMERAAVFLIVYTVFYLWLGPPFTPRVMLYPFILLALVMMAWSLSVMVASLVVFFRDMQRASTLLLRLLLYLCPILYPIGFVPSSFREIYLYNPLACIFAWLQWSLLGGEQPFTGPTIVLVLFLPALLIGAHSTYALLSVKFTKVL